MTSEPGHYQNKSPSEESLVKIEKDTLLAVFSEKLKRILCIYIIFKLKKIQFLNGMCYVFSLSFNFMIQGNVEFKFMISGNVEPAMWVNSKHTQPLCQR